MSIYYKERLKKYKNKMRLAKNTRLHFAWIIYTKSTQPQTLQAMT